MTKLTREKKAFSLVELSMVIIVTGILIATTLQGVTIIRSFKIMGARAQTKSAAINGIPEIIAWYDTTSEKSFNKKEALDGKKISQWNDINSQSDIGNNATQPNISSRPIYTFEGSVANGLPTLRFDGDDYFNLPDSTIPFSDYEYTIFSVMRVPTTSESYGVLGSGDFQTEKGSNMINYRAGGFVENNWQKNTLLTPVICVSAGKMQVFTFYYENTSGRKIYVNGSFKGQDSEVSHNGLTINNTIGKSSVYGIADLYFKGDIGEIIIFGRALNKEERQMVEKYLAKKWSITL